MCVAREYIASWCVVSVAGTLLLLVLVLSLCERAVLYRSGWAQAPDVGRYGVGAAVSSEIPPVQLAPGRGGQQATKNKKKSPSCSPRWRPFAGMSSRRRGAKRPAAVCV